MAKQVASLDHLSDGRLVLGIGAGWNAEEMENHGTPFARRWPILRERTLAMREMWCQEEPEFHGEFVDFDKIWCYPKPKQAGGPPILMGASSRYTYDRIAEYADGWMPIYQNRARRQASGGVDYAAGIAKTKEAWQARGRKGSPQFSIFGVGADRRAVAELVELGFDRVIFSLPSDAADVVLPLLEKYASIAHEFTS
jgi:alkanesulfonate monooxygenase SsuD/methylene tetrahydromethanopterin reductase-like flavin-dependent oxidoreductase (luciferase family)